MMATNDSPELTDRHKKAINALLACSTTKGAALMCGLSERTVHRYLHLPHFKTALSERQDEMLAATSAALSGLSQIAVEALTQALAVLSRQAGGNVADFITLDAGGTWSLNLTGANDDELLPLVKKLHTDKDGVDRMELHDSQSAAVALGRLAVAVLEQRRRSHELDELAARLTAVEEASKRQDRGER